VHRLVALVSAAGLAFVACGSGNEEPPNAQPDDGEVRAPLFFVGERANEVTVLRLETETGGCREQPPKLGEVDVDETAEVITVTASIVPSPVQENPPCDSQLFVIPVTVSLERPLGERRVLDGSCQPPVDVVVRSEDRSPCTPSPKVEAAAGAVGKWEQLNAGPLATRGEAKGVWTGEEMIVLGGLAIERYAAFDDAAAYDPSTKKWRRLAKRPDPGRILGVAWTGKEIFAVGQRDGIALENARSAHMYDPATDTWRAIAEPPRGVNEAYTFWTGSEVGVWQVGGGLLFNPSTNTWRDIPTIDIAGVTAPGRARWLEGVGLLSVQAAAGSDGGGPLRDALVLFDPSKNTWKKAANAPSAIPSFTFLYAAWLGTEELFGSSGGAEDASAFAYDPRRDRWRTTTTPKSDPEQIGFVMTGVPIDDGRGVLFGDKNRPLWMFDSKAGSWSYAAAPSGSLPASDGVMVWTGKDVLVFGRPANANAESPNAAWKWTPP
jgi:hypothetical protein